MVDSGAWVGQGDGKCLGFEGNMLSFEGDGMSACDSGGFLGIFESEVGEVVYTVFGQVYVDEIEEKHRT